MRSSSWATLATILSLAACQAAPPAATPLPEVVNGVGYMLLNAPITNRSRDLFVQDVGRLVNAGATSIHLAINSPGGSIDAAQGFVDEIARLHTQRGVEFDVYNTGLVASAASYIFLGAQKRYAAPRSAFIFHAATATSSGPANAQDLRDSADKLDAYERTVRATLKARTRLTDGETLTYVRRTVLLNADDARRDGVVDSIAPFTMPSGARAWVISATPPTPGARPVPPSPPIPN